MALLVWTATQVTDINTTLAVHTVEIQSISKQVNNVHEEELTLRDMLGEVKMDVEKIKLRHELEFEAADSQFIGRIDRTAN